MILEEQKYLKGYFSSYRQRFLRRTQNLNPEVKELQPKYFN